MNLKRRNSTAPNVLFAFTSDSETALVFERDPDIRYEFFNSLLFFFILWQLLQSRSLFLTLSSPFSSLFDYFSPHPLFTLHIHLPSSPTPSFSFFFLLLSSPVLFLYSAPLSSSLHLITPHVLSIHLSTIYRMLRSHMSKECRDQFDSGLIQYLTGTIRKN